MEMVLCHVGSVSRINSVFIVRVEIFILSVYIGSTMKEYRVTSDETISAPTKPEIVSRGVSMEKGPLAWIEFAQSEMVMYRAYDIDGGMENIY